jgi:hypothetical protein
MKRGDSARSASALVLRALLAWGFLQLSSGVVGDAAPRSSSLLDEARAQLLLGELSGVNAKHAVTRLTGFHRTPASSGFHDAIELLRTLLTGFGVTDVRIEAYGADGPRPLSRRLRQGPPVWEVTRAELRAVDPPRKIVSFAEEPISLARYSRPAHVVAELIDVGAGVRDEDYRGRPVKGKLVLATGYAGTVEQIAVGRYGASGVVISGASSYSEETGWGYPDMVNWQVLNPRAVQGREPTFAFVVSEREGGRLRSALATGHAVRLEALVDSSIGSGPQEILTAVIPGSTLPREEILLLAHLDHVRPSANDNASGSALLLEIARTLQRLIDTKRLERPERSIRFLWMTEGAGTFGYANAHPDLGQQALAALNLDMVGEFLVPGTGPLRVTRTPDWIPSFLIDAIVDMAQYVDTQAVYAPTGSRSVLNLRVSPFSPSSDHYTLNDAAIGVPTTLLHHTDPFHHANIDQPDKVDPTELARVGFIAAATAYYLASVGDREAGALAGVVYAGGTRRLSDAVDEGLMLLTRSAPADLEESFGFAIRKLDHTTEREQRVLESVSRLGRANPEALARALAAAASAHRDVLAARYAALVGSPPTPRRLSPAEAQAAGIVPRRTPGYLCGNWRQELDVDALTETERMWLSRYESELRQSYMRIPAFLSYMDGRRSMLEIRDRVASEYFDFLEGSESAGRHEDISLEYRRIPIEGVLELLAILKKGGLVHD